MQPYSSLSGISVPFVKSKQNGLYIIKTSFCTSLIFIQFIPPSGSTHIPFEGGGDGGCIGGGGKSGFGGGNAGATYISSNKHTGHIKFNLVCKELCIYGLHSLHPFKTSTHPSA